MFKLIFCEVLSTGKYKPNYPFRYTTQRERGRDGAGERSQQLPNAANTSTQLNRTKSQNLMQVHLELQ